MNSFEPQLDNWLEEAIREKGAIAHLKQFEALRSLRRRRIRWITVSLAACLALFIVGAGLKLSINTRTAGYGFNPADGQKGGSEITALMQERRNREALDRIEATRTEVSAEIANPVSSDPDYLDQLQVDLQELDLLQAVCYMRQGRFFKSRKMLQEISRKDGAFASEADSLLDKM